MIDFRPEIAADVGDSNLAWRYLDKERASLLYMMAESVLGKTGWVNYVRSKTFMASDGLNRTIPMSENYGGYDKAIWVQTSLPNEISVFRRASYVARADYWNVPRLAKTSHVPSRDQHLSRGCYCSNLT